MNIKMHMIWTCWEEKIVISNLFLTMYGRRSPSLVKSAWDSLWLLVIFNFSSVVWLSSHKIWIWFQYSFLIVPFIIHSNVILMFVNEIQIFMMWASSIHKYIFFFFFSAIVSVQQERHMLAEITKWQLICSLLRFLYLGFFLCSRNIKGLIDFCRTF